MRRAAYSTPANIAEGCERGTDADFWEISANGYGFGE
jgi:four helix bundle protein